MAKKNKTIDFDQSFEELKLILQSIQSEDTGIEALSKYVEQANILLQKCRERLRQIEENTQLTEQSEE